MIKQKTETIIIRVTPELKAKLQKLAEADERSLSDYVRIQIQKLVASTVES